MNRIIYFLHGIISRLYTSTKISFRHILLAFFIAAIVLLLGLAFCKSNDLSLEYLTGDMAKILDGPFYAGIISNLGILIWIGTGGICLFTYALERKINPKNQKGFFLFSAIILFFLGLDDLLMFHEKTFLELFHLNEAFLFLVYVIIIFIYLLRYYNQFLNSKHIILFFIALCFFSISIIMDKNVFKLDKNSYLYNLLEDGTKFTGIIFWSIYLVNYSYIHLLSTFKIIGTSDNVLYRAQKNLN